MTKFTKSLKWTKVSLTLHEWTSASVTIKKPRFKDGTQSGDVTSSYQTDVVWELNSVVLIVMTKSVTKTNNSSFSLFCGWTAEKGFKYSTCSDSAGEIQSIISFLELLEKSWMFKNWYNGSFLVVLLTRHQYPWFCATSIKNMLWLRSHLSVRTHLRGREKLLSPTWTQQVVVF